VSLDLREPPKNGEAQIVFRCLHEDRDLVQAAAALLGVSVNKFMRSVVIQAARQVIHENNKPEPEKKMVLRDDTAPGMEIGALPPGMKKT